MAGCVCQVARCFATTKEQQEEDYTYWTVIWNFLEYRISLLIQHEMQEVAFILYTVLWTLLERQHFKEIQHLLVEQCTCKILEST